MQTCTGSADSHFCFLPLLLIFAWYSCSGCTGTSLLLIQDNMQFPGCEGSKMFQASA